MGTRRLSTTVAVCLLAAGVFGCASTKERSAGDYFAEANENFRHGALTLAVEEFHELLDQHPFSEHNEEAELKIAHAHYLAGDYAEAIVALTDFQRRHPTSPHLPFVGYSLGMCYVKQMGTIDRDQTNAQNAQAYFITVSRQYPDSPYALLAREQLSMCREELGQHELYVADFYVKRGNDKAAEARLLDLAARYGETEAAANGLLNLARYYDREHQDANAALAYETVIDNSPKSPQAEEARKALANLSDDASGSHDPLDVLLAAKGRPHPDTNLETVKLPDVTKVRQASRGAPPPAPAAFGPTGASPFGRPRPY
jgi:outer membrane protein assembly factor BamD